MRIIQQVLIYSPVLWGCDSTVTVTLTIQNVINTNIDTTLCNGGSIVVNGTTYNGSNPTGQETFTLPVVVTV